jgi:hypothetical protein
MVEMNKKAQDDIMSKSTKIIITIICLLVFLGLLFILKNKGTSILGMFSKLFGGG